jgi:2'-5' RNA ligase
MHDERMRLFVALELPDPIRAALIGWRGRAVGASDALRPLEEGSLHVTMCFLGWQAASDADAIASACEVLAPEHAPHLSLATPRWLPPRRPRVLAVDLDDPAGVLARAQATLSHALAAAGWYQPEQRPYLAHVTVARVARGARVPRTPLPPAPRHEFDATRVTLFRSRLFRSGARYEALSTVELAC